MNKLLESLNEKEKSLDLKSLPAPYKALLRIYKRNKATVEEFQPSEEDFIRYLNSVMESLREDLLETDTENPLRKKIKTALGVLKRKAEAVGRENVEKRIIRKIAYQTALDILEELETIEPEEETFSTPEPEEPPKKPNGKKKKIRSSSSTKFNKTGLPPTMDFFAAVGGNKSN